MPGPDNDISYHRITACPDLQAARGNIYLWQVYALERSCALTLELLRQRGELVAMLRRFIKNDNGSPFRQYQPLAFLASLADHADPVVVSVSQFELALFKVHSGDAATYTVRWTVDPHDVLYCLARGLPFLAIVDGCIFVTHVASSLPHGFTVQIHDVATLPSLLNVPAGTTTESSRDESVPAHLAPR